MRYRNSKGITVLELVIGAVVVGVIAAMAAPEFGDVVKRLRFKRASRDMVSAMRLARSDAIAQRTQVGLYFDYSSNGYVIFKDQINPDQFTYDVGDSVVKTIGLEGGVSLYYHTFTGSAVIFKPDGSASSSGNVVLSDQEWTRHSVIDVLASTGRVRLTYQYGDEYY